MIEPLRPEDCPLLNSEDTRIQTLLGSFNAAAQQLALLPETFGREFEADEAFVEFERRLAGVRKSLAKTYYRIGFIGPTQSGKSTTVNYVLDSLSPVDQPCKEGTGDNTTSTVSRLRLGRRKLDLLYMSRPQFNEKRKQLCLMSGLDQDLSNEALLARIPSRLEEIKSGAETVLDSGQAILEQDVVLLRRLLEAAREEGGKIGADHGKTLSVPYADRSRYLNYGVREDRANPLLREGVVHYESPYLSERLEMFDLPGPGAKSSIDQWTTEQYLGDMDGVMLFIYCNKLGDDSVERLYAQLRRNFRERAARRAWIIFTRWDAPTRAALEGDGETSVFTGIDLFLKNKNIPTSQIRFVCSPWYQPTFSIHISRKNVLRGTMEVEFPENPAQGRVESQKISLVFDDDANGSSSGFELLTRPARYRLELSGADGFRCNCSGEWPTEDKRFAITAASEGGGTAEIEFQKIEVESDSIQDHFRKQLRSPSPIPSELNKFPEYRPAFQSLFIGGGIPALRSLILEQLPVDIEQEILETAQQAIATIRSDIRRRFLNAVRKQTATATQADEVGRCKARMDQLLMDMERQLPTFEKAALLLRKGRFNETTQNFEVLGLEPKFAEICPAREVLDRFRSASTEFPQHARDLQKTLEQLVQYVILPDLYEQWKPRFDALPKVPVREDLKGQPLTPGLAWDEFAEVDREEFLEKQIRFPSFIDQQLFAAGGNPNAEADLEDGQAYRDMMMEKILLVAQQSVHSIRAALVARAMQIKKELDQLSRGSGGAPIERSSTYDQAQAKMEELSKCHL